MAKILIIFSLLSLSIDGIAREARARREVERPEVNRSERRKEVRQEPRQNISKQAVDVGQNVRDNRQDARRATVYTTARVVKVMGDDGVTEQMECCPCQAMTPAELNVSESLPPETTPAY